METESYNGVHISSKNVSRFICSKCYNESVSEEMGLNFEHLSFHPLTLADKDGEDHSFHFRPLLHGDHLLIEAFEIKDSEPKGYKYSIHGYAEDDLFHLFGKLVERMRRELQRRHIEAGYLNRYNITDNHTVRGHITWDDDTDGELPCLVIDGKEVSWHEFGRMVMTYEGFHFKLEIFEGTKEK